MAGSAARGKLGHLEKALTVSIRAVDTPGESSAALVQKLFLPWLTSP